MEIDLRTEAEKRRDALHNDVCVLYRQIKESCKGFSDSRIMRTVGNKYGVTEMCVRGILTKRGVYVPKRSKLKV